MASQQAAEVLEGDSLLMSPLSPLSVKSGGSRKKNGTVCNSSHISQPLSPKGTKGGILS